ncbi:pilus (MSHA type) biogenesis protein MshL [Desulfuromonas thiophila]|uniref:MSHA biogenesis protein MshL n=1 Tax=Desulfuromonas thiophila TaxID=57664 RepID=A0A1G6ZKI8_9BACT|nr:pilus (MSHA type) biogenesis protein MshL [Desulfuromonas thiophila]SDE02942.1 MSHA biogenesis protein MshL [Desulfuromonas thiophila]
MHPACPVVSDRQRRGRWRVLGLLLVLLGLTACTPAWREQPQRQTLLEQSLAEDPAATAEAAPAALPEAVRQALLPPLPQAEALAAPRFDVAAEQVPARSFFAALAADTGANMVVHPALEGDISLHLQQVTLEEALELVSQLYGYEYRPIPGGYQVLPDRPQTRIFQIDYLTLRRIGKSLTRVSSGQVSEDSRRSDNASDSGSDPYNSQKTSQSGSWIETNSDADFWPVLQQTLEALLAGEDGASVVVQPHAGLVVVRARPRQLALVADYLQQTQGSLQRQVILEAKILEVELSEGYQTGINWGSLVHNGQNLARIGQVGGGTSLAKGQSEIAGAPVIFAPQTNPEGLPVDGLVSSAFGGVFSAVLSFDDFEAFIEAVRSQGDVQVLSSPRVATVNNQKAVIKVGTDEFFVTDVSSDTVTGTTTTTTPDITLTPFFSGIALDVTPQIGASGSVTLHVHPTVSEVVDQTKVITVAGQEQTLPLAFSSVRESDTIVHARSGQVVVIGGLMKNRLVQNRAGVPFLAEVPLLGHLFRHQKEELVKSELVILLRPQVVEDARGWHDDLQDSRVRLQRLLPGAR